MEFLSISQRKNLGSSLALPANGLGGSRATSLSVAHFALQNTKFCSKNVRTLFKKHRQESPFEKYAQQKSAIGGRVFPEGLI